MTREFTGIERRRLASIMITARKVSELADSVFIKALHEDELPDLVGDILDLQRHSVTLATKAMNLKNVMIERGLK